MSRRDIGTVVALAILLACIAFAKKATDGCAGNLAGLAGEGATAPEPEDVDKELAAAKALPPAGRLETHLKWIALGSPLATISLETWLESDFPAGSLTATQRASLAETVLESPSRSLRKAAAGALLGDNSLPADGPAHIGCRRVRGELGAKAMREQAGKALGDPEAARWLAAHGPGAMKHLLRALDKGTSGAQAGLRALSRSYPETRRDAISELIPRLRDASKVDAALPALKEIADMDLGTDPEVWEDWWRKLSERLEQLER